MSKTKYVRYDDRGFWAYDVALGVFLKHLIDAAEANDQATSAWLSRATQSWREVACISDFGLTFDSHWSEADRLTFLTLAETACSRLSQRTSIPAQEIVNWRMLDDLQIFPRGATQVLTFPIVELGQAIIALVRGELPEAPCREGMAVWNAKRSRRAWNDAVTLSIDHLFATRHTEWV